jgi:hypothetical protein
MVGGGRNTPGARQQRGQSKEALQPPRILGRRRITGTSRRQKRRPDRQNAAQGVPCVNSDRPKKHRLNMNGYSFRISKATSHPAAAKPNAAMQNYVPKSSLDKTKATLEND